MLAFNVAFLASDKRRTSSKVSALANLRSPYMLTFENVCQRKRRMNDMKILILLKHRLPKPPIQAGVFCPLPAAQMHTISLSLSLSLSLSWIYACMHAYMTELSKATCVCVCVCVWCV
jgi:hypothetical protein